MRKLTLSTLSGWVISLCIYLLASATMSAQCPTGTLEGVVYLDDNKSGSNESEDGFPNVVITVFDEAEAQVGMAITNNAGAFSINGLTDGLEYRVEYSYSSSVSATFNQSTVNSDVQFVETPSCALTFGVTDRSLLCGTSDDIVLTCFARSDGSDNLDLPSIIGVPFEFERTDVPVVYATHGETGAVWGVAFNYATNQIYTSAFIKQNSNLGSTFDAIYSTVPQGNGYQTSVFTTLSALGQITNTPTVTDPFDCAYGDQVGHLGLGGLAISADGNDLYVVNIGDNTLVKMSSTNPTASTTVSYQIPNPGCGVDENKPFALTEHNGKFYVGVTCTAESVRTSSQSTATVYEFDPVTELFTLMFTTNQTVGFWADIPVTSNKVSQWLTDIAFTDESHMVLAFADRKGHRYCEEPGDILNDQEGDILLVVNINGTWVLESNGQVSSFTGTGVNNGDGPNGGEFFGDDFWMTDPDYHNETSLGAIYAHPATGEIVSAVFDPITDAYSGGLHRYSTQNGALAEPIQFYSHNNSEYFGKATGFGGITSKCGYAGLEIGNFVWFDDNNNGIQDPGEDPVNGLPLILYDEFCNIVATTTTDDNGEYNFSTADGLLYNSTYYLAIDPVVYDAVTGSYTLNNLYYIGTVDGISSLSGSDFIANASGCNAIDGQAAITINTGGNADNNHTFDIGLSVVEAFDLALILTSDVRSAVEGDDVKYTIHVENQGSVTANNIKVIDYIPEGMILNDSNWDASADGTSACHFINLPNGLLPGESVEECITLTVVEQGDDVIKINVAEIAYAENENGDDFTQKDVDSTPDEIKDNDFGGEAFSNNDNRLSGNGTEGDDEDDSDPEGLYFVSFTIDDPCVCIGEVDGVIQFSELVTVTGPAGQMWTVDFVAGFYDATGTLFPVGTALTEVSTDPITNVSTYELPGVRFVNEPLSIRVMNEDGVFLQIQSEGCTTDSEVVIVSDSGTNAVCIDGLETFTVDLATDCTLDWAVNGSTTGITVIDNETIDVDFSILGLGEHTITVDQDCPDDACAASAEFVVTVGGSNGILACPNDLNISLDNDCTATITPELILTSPLTDGAAYGIMITDAQGNVLPSNVITGEYLGETLEVKVIDACSGNACWGYVHLEDKTPPTIECTEPIEVPCYDVNTFMPFAEDNCTDVTVEVIGDFPTALWCDDDHIKEIERTYLATDDWGNTASCTQTILVKRFPYEDVVRPDEEVTITCAEADANQNADGQPSPCLTGVPTLFGASLYGEAGCESDLQDDLCEVAFSYEDVLYFQGECLTKYMRTWHYYENYCAPFGYENFTQLIIIEDNEAPIFDEPLSVNGEIITTGGNLCEMTYTLPAPVVSDDCAVELTFDVTVFTEEGVPTFYNDLTLSELTMIEVSLPFGDNTITYTVKDGCDNLVADSFVITVVDTTSPTAVCEGNTVISLNEDGVAHAFASTFDDGSHDDCSDVQILVMRDELCECKLPIIPGMNYLGEFVDASGDTHYYYNSSRLVRGFLADNLATAYGGYLAAIDSPDELAYISSVMMMDAYVGGDDFTVLSGGATTLVEGLDQLPFILEIENPCSWSEKIQFCCEDYDADPTTPDVIVTVRVIDAFGNFTDCNPTNVHIQNKILPLLACPDDVTLDCTESTLHSMTTEEELNEMFGTFTTDVCATMIVPTSVFDLNTCGVGTIERTFSALNTNGTPILDNDGEAVACTMMITVENDDPLVDGDIDWPEDLTDVEVNCFMTDIDPQSLADTFGDEFGFPTVPPSKCYSATVPTFMDSEPFVTPDGKIKIIRTWTISDECNDHEEFTHVQKFKFIDLGNCEMLDVALRKTVVTPGPYRRGDIITFQIEVFNQGNIDAFNIGVIDYIPNGLTFVTGSVNNAAWTLIDPNTATLTTPIATIPFGMPAPSTTLLIDLMVDSNVEGTLSNFAEVTSVDDDNDPNNTSLDDVDSTPDTVVANDVLTDDEVDLTPTTGDEDDHDVETVFVDLFDLALTKVVNTTATPGPYTPGSTIQFTISIINQGTLDAFDVDIEDYAPVGLSTPTLVAGQTGVVMNPTGDFTVASVAAGTTFTFEVEGIIDATYMGTSLINDAEITGGSDSVGGPDTNDDDSSPGDDGTPDDILNDDDVTDVTGGDDQDPAEVTVDQVFDLALTKVVNTTATPGPFTPGSTVQFTISIINQGTLDAFDVDIEDYAPVGLSAPTLVAGQTGVVMNPTGDFTVASVAVGTTFTFEVEGIIDATYMGTSLINDAEITGGSETIGGPDAMDEDSIPGDNGTPDDIINDNDVLDVNGGDDQDPAQVAVGQVFDLALTKVINTTATPGPFTPGSTVQFTISIVNQGSLDAFDVDVADYAPVGLSVPTLVAGQTGVVMNPTGDFTVASVTAGTTFTFEVEGIIDATYMGTSLINDAEITGGSDTMGGLDATDEDSTPGDNAFPDEIGNDNNVIDTNGSDDQDPAEVIVEQVFDLALTKVINTTATPGPYAPGSTVQFTITIINQGTLNAFDIDVLDYAPTGLSVPTLVAGQTGVVMNAAGDFTVTSLAAGATTTFEVEGTIDSGFMGASLINDAEITGGSTVAGGADATDADSTPGDNAFPDEIGNDNNVVDINGSDDQDPAEVLVDQIFDLALTKMIDTAVSTGPYLPGDTVTFQICVINQGTLDATGVEVIDYIPADMMFVSSPDFMLVGTDYIATVDVAAGMTECLSISLEIDEDFAGTSIINDAEIFSSDADVDSTPGDDGTPDDVGNDDDVTDIAGGDDQDPAIVMIGCTVPTCGNTDYTVSIPNDLPVILYPFLDMDGMVQLSETPVIPTGFEGCENFYTVELDENEIFCNPKDADTLKITIIDIVLADTLCCDIFITKIDEIDPVLDCEEFLTRTCDQLFFNDDGTLDVEPFEPEATDNCSPVTITSTVDMSGLDDMCNTGTIIIDWLATDCYDNTDECTQTIVVSATELTISDIVFPDDFVLENCGDSTDPEDTGMVIINGSTCGEVTITFEDSVPGEDTCQDETIRTFTVTDVCATSGDGIFTGTQTISFVDDEGPVISGIPVLEDIYEVLPPDCVVTLDITAMLADDCSAIDSMFHVINGDTILNSFDASGDYEVGSYTIDFVGVDVCGNSSIETVSFTVAEPILPPGISCLKVMFEVGPDGPTIVTPEDLAFGGFNCSDEDFEYFFLAGDPGIDLAPDDPPVILPNQMVDCDNLAPFNVYIGLYEDGEYTGDFCVAEIDGVDVDPEDCPEDGGNGLVGGVFGTIMSELGEVISKVSVDVIGDMTESSESTTSGAYMFDNLEMGGVYRITPTKDHNHRNGVSTLDIILVQRHLLGIEQLDSPYKYIAADVSKNGQISAQDLVEMRKLVLEVTDRFPTNKSFRMVDAGYEFLEGVNPLELNFPERYDIYGLNTDMNIDFIGVKIGDVNNSAIFNELQDVAVQIRSEQAIFTYADDILVNDSESVINLELVSEDAFVGFQTKLEIEAGVLVDVTSDLPGFDVNNYSIDGKVLTISYNTPTLELVRGGNVSLTLISETDSKVSDIINVDHTHANELYTAEGISNLSLSPIVDKSTGLSVYQNSPNPFADYTQIIFDLAESTQVELVVYSPDGKVVLTRTLDGVSGLNTVTVNNDDLPAEGLYYYELDNGVTRVMKRMLKVK